MGLPCSDLLLWLQDTGISVTLSGQIHSTLWPDLLESSLFETNEDSVVQSWCDAATVVENPPYESDFPNLTVHTAIPTDAGVEQPSSSEDLAPERQTDPPSAHFHSFKLDLSTSGNAHPQRQCSPEGDSVQHENIRIRSDTQLFKTLSVHDLPEFLELLFQPWLLAAFNEFTDSFLRRYRQQHLDYLQRCGYQLAEVFTRHKFKIDRAIKAVESRETMFYDPAPDKSLWGSDDHDLRFVVSIVQGAENNRAHPWDAPTSTATLVRRAVALVLWFRLINRPGTGGSAEKQRTDRFKRHWSRITDCLYGMEPRSSKHTIATAIDTATPALEPSVEPPLLGLEPFQPTGTMSTDTGTPEDLDDYTSDHRDGAVMVSEAGDSIELGLEVDLEDFTLPENFIFSALTAASPRLHPALVVDQASQSNIAMSPGSIHPNGIVTAADRGQNESMLPSMFRTHECFDADILNTTQGQLVDNTADSTAPDFTDPYMWPLAGYSFDPTMWPLDNSHFDVAPATVALNQQRGVFWLTEEASVIHRNQLAGLLGYWGVTADHQQSCTLTLNPWSSFFEPGAIGNFDRATTAEEEQSQARFIMSDLTTTWACANTWFAAWPRGYRRVGELEDLINPDTEKADTLVHGSQLCGHPACVAPGHAVVETSAQMKSRTQCIEVAKSDRAHGMKIPKHCDSHEPPCLLVQACLTSRECLAIQDWRRSLAHGFKTDKILSLQPLDHPEAFETFESSLPVTFEMDPTPVDTTQLTMEGAVLAAASSEAAV